MDWINRFSFDLRVVDECDKHDKFLFPNSDLKVVGYFSVNDNNEYCPDTSQLKYICYNDSRKEISVKLDLNYKLNNVIRKEELKTWDKLNNMFTWLGLNSSRILPVVGFPFVTFRGNLTSIMGTPYEKSTDWTICAKVFDGIIYLNSFETATQTKRVASAGDHEKACQLWGYKFEQYLATIDPSKKPDASAICKTIEEFCCVFDRKFGEHRLIYGAEMDGIADNKVIDQQNVLECLSKAKLVELKTSRVIETFGNDVSFRKYKVLKWWCQSYLVGIEHIICGFRDDKGVVRVLKRFNTNELPELGKGYWDKNVCLNFLHRFLDFIKRLILETDNGKDFVWKFDYLIRERRIAASRIADPGSIYSSNFKEIKICKVEL